MGALAQSSGSGDVGYSDQGLPTGIGVSTDPSVSVNDPNQSRNLGLIGSIEYYGAKAVHGVESGAEAVLDTGEAAIKTVYGAGKTVVGDVVGGAENVVGFANSQIIFLVLAVGFGLYLATKSGGLRIGL